MAILLQLPRHLQVIRRHLLASATRSTVARKVQCRRKVRRPLLYALSGVPSLPLLHTLFELLLLLPHIHSKKLHNYFLSVQPHPSIITRPRRV